MSIQVLESLTISHTLKRERHGFGLDGYIIPACSCGWRGHAEYEDNDRMMTNLQEQESAHVKGGKHHG